MRTTGSAKQLAQDILALGPSSCATPVILDTKTLEFEEGWVFFYQSKRFIETGEFDELLVGNAPVFVPRDDKAPCFINYHRPITESIEAYRISGNASAMPKSQIRLYQSEPGANVIAAIQCIRQYSASGMAVAKSAVDSCLTGKSILLDTQSPSLARTFVNELSKFGFVAEVMYGA